MRFLFVQNIPPLDPRSGGGQRIHDALVRTLREQGHDARAAFLSVDGTTPTVPYPSWATAESGRFVVNVLRMRRLVGTILEEWVPDVFYGAAAEAAEALVRMPSHVLTVATSHHYDPPDLRGLVEPLKPLATFRRMRARQMQLLERRMLRRADLLLSTSSFAADALATRGYVGPDHPVQVLRNGVDPDWFESGGSEADRHGLLFVGRLDAQKGADVLLDALARSRGRWPLTVVGDGPARKELAEQRRRLAIEDRVDFVGFEGPTVVRERMRKAGALVVPSRAENYPLVILEGLASGVPVVTTPVGGIREMVTQGESALLTPAEDVGALAAALERIETEPDLRARLAVGGRAVAEAHRWSAIAEHLLGYVESVRPATYSTADR